MSNPQTEESDIPFIGNDLTGRPGTMGNPLDTADAPGKADSELGEESSVLEASAWTRPQNPLDNPGLRPQ